MNKNRKLTKTERTTVYEKYNKHCAYCGKEIEIKDMQVDHITPQWRFEGVHAIQSDANDMGNLNPSCRRCNHYKRGDSLEVFRQKLKTIHDRVCQIYICKVAEDYGIIKIEPWDGKFYFEKEEE